MRAHCKCHVLNEDAHIHSFLKENFSKFEYRNREFLFQFSFFDIRTLKACHLCAKNCTKCVLFANIMFPIKILIVEWKHINPIECCWLAFFCIRNMVINVVITSV